MACTQHPAGTAVSHPGRRHTRLRLSSDTGHLGTGRGTAMGLSATGATTLIGVGTPTGILDINTVICDRRFVTSSRCPVRTLVDVTYINQLMHHGPKSIIPSHLKIIRRLWSLRRIILDGGGSAATGIVTNGWDTTIGLPGPLVSTGLRTAF